MPPENKKIVNRILKTYSIHDFLLREFSRFFVGLRKKSRVDFEKINKFGVKKMVCALQNNIAAIRFHTNENYLGDNEMLKIYWTLWAAIAAFALLLFATGNFTLMTLIAFGFVSFGMIFMGMIAVLPSTVGHHTVPEEPKVKAEKVKEERIFQTNPLVTR